MVFTIWSRTRSTLSWGESMNVDRDIKLTSQTSVRAAFEEGRAGMQQHPRRRDGSLLDQRLALDSYVRSSLLTNADISDANTGSMILSINDGRVSSEMRSNGLHFGHRNSSLPAPPNGPQSTSIVQPRRVEPHAVASRPTPAPARPSESATSAPKILAKPTEGPAGAAANKAVPSKPAQPTQGSQATTTSAPPAYSSIKHNPPPSSIPPKPMAPSRQPRGPGSVAQPPAPANKVENKSAPAPPAKPSTPVGNRKSPAPGPKGDKAPSKLASTETTEKKVESAAPATTEKKEAGKPEEGSHPIPARPYEKRSLFLKKIPIPTSEEEIKALFPNQKTKVSYQLQSLEKS
jgi:hypothetical protein